MVVKMKQANAVQNTKPVEQAVQTALANPPIQANVIPPDAKKFAAKMIDEAYEIQWRKGGIEDVKKELESLQDKVSEKVYAVAKRAVELTNGNLRIALAMFTNLCTFAEEHIKAYHTEKAREVVSVGKLIPQWSVYKSDIAKGLEKGLNPFERNEGGSLCYATAADYRRKVKEMAKEAGDNATGSQAGQERNNGTMKDNVVTLTRNGWEDSLAAAFGILNEKLNQLTKEQQAMFTKDILALATRADALILQNHDTAAQVAKGRGPVDEIVREMESTGAVIDDETRQLMQDAVDKQGKDGKTVAQEIARAATARQKKASKAEAA